MYWSVVLLLTSRMVCGQSVKFTINSIQLSALPSSTLRNGDNLSLHCFVDIAKTTNFELTSTFNFYKDDNLVYSVNSSDAEAYHTIHNASVSRSGLYKCQINADGRQKTSEEIKVKVTGLAPPLIRVSKVEVKEGDQITVTCEAPNEEPPMSFNFYKTDIERGAPKKKKSTENKAETTYVIKEGENILHFECSIKLVSDEEPESPLSRRQMVTVAAPFGTPIIRVWPSNNFTEGAVMKVACTVHKSHINSENVTISLQKDNKILEISYSGILNYSRVATVDNMGNYTCKAEGKAASKTSSTTIKVKELFPRPRLVLKSSNMTKYINDGDAVDLECSVSSLLPQESSKQNFYLINNKGERRRMTKGGRDRMNLRAKDSGIYTCEVTIANITKTSEPVQVEVYAAVTKPELKQIRTDTVVVLGDNLTLSCKSSSGTPPIVYTLYRESKKLDVKEVADNREAIFMVKTNGLPDVGKYQCHAYNRNHKSSSFSEVLNITVVAPVREVSLIIIPINGEVEEGAELSLVCKAKYGTLPITFFFYVKRDKEIRLSNMTKTDKMSAEFIVPSFTKQKDGTYFCTASNKVNMSAGSASMAVKAVLARWKKGVIVAFVCLILVAALGIALYLYLDKKKKGRNMIANSSRSAKTTNSGGDKPAADVKSDDSYFGSVQNEEELHILRTAEENIGNNQQNHDMGYTEVDGSAADPQYDAAENNFSESPEINNLS